MKKNKKAQEEMVGFAIIIVIVAVLILIFLSFSLRKNTKTNVESFEVENYLQAILYYTTECEDDFGYLPIKRLILRCEEGFICKNNKNACQVLNETLKNICNETWKIGENRPVKGYLLNVSINGNNEISIKEGNYTNNARSARQELPLSDNEVEIRFEAYY